MEYKTGKLLEEIQSKLSDLIGRYSYHDKDRLNEPEHVREVLNNIIHEIERHLES